MRWSSKRNLITQSVLRSILHNTSFRFEALAKTKAIQNTVDVVQKWNRVCTTSNVPYDAVMVDFSCQNGSKIGSESVT